MKRYAPLAALVAAALAAVIWYLAKGDKDGAETAAAKPKPQLDLTPHRRAERPGRGRSGELPVLFDDDPEGSLRLEGLVIDAAEVPVPGAVVAIDSNPPRVVETGEDGSFAVDKLVARSYQVVARAEAGVAGPVTMRLSATSDPVTLKLRAPGSLEVTVLDAAKGEPIAGAEVEVRDIDVQTQTSGTGGVARFSPLVPTGYQVVASADGFAPQHAWVRVPGAGGAATVRLALRRGAAVSGVVVDPKGEPVAGARVMYQGASEWSQRADPRWDAAETDAAGKFAFAALPAGTFRFVARARGQAPGRSDLVTLDGQRPVDDLRIQLQPAATLRGRVLTAAGEPVAAARVRVGAGGGFRRRLREAYAGDDGTYRIDGLERRALEVVAVGSDAASDVTQVDLSEPPFDRTLDLTLDVDGVIAGVVVDGDGEPIEGAQVWSFPDWRRGGGSPGGRGSFRMRGMPRALTDAGGRFRLTGLAAGPYQVRASRDSELRGGRGFLVPPTAANTGDTDLRIELPDGGRITGKVALESGEAPASFTVGLGGFGRGTPFFSKDGKFELPDLPPRRYTLTVRGPGFDARQLSDVQVEAGEVTDLGTIKVRKGRTIVGRVVDAGGSPVPGATVRAGRMIFGNGTSSSSRFGGPMARGAKEATTDDAGEFAVYGLGSGDVSIVAEHETLGRSPSVLIQNGGRSVSDMVLELAPYGSLEGTVKRGGAPAEEVIIMAASLRSPDISYGVATGPDGKYRFDRLAPDDYKVSAMLGRNPMRGFGFQAHRVTVRSGETAHLDIAVEAGQIDLVVALADRTGANLGFSAVIAASGELQASSARDLDLQVKRRPDGFSAQAFSIAGREATLRRLVPGVWTVCAVPYPTEVQGMADTLAYMEREGDKLAVFCQRAEVAESPDEQRLSIEVEVPAFVPPPQDS